VRNLVEEELIIDKLDELIFWTKFSALPTFRSLLSENLKSEIDQLVYDLSDGERSTRDIAKILSKGGRKVTHVTIANMWNKWLILNLVIPAKRKGRYKKVLSLDSLGIKIPAAIKRPKSE
jgi:hypothetical protein